LNIRLVFAFFLATVLLTPLFIANSFAENLSPRQQWVKYADPDLMTCKEGYILLQKNNGYPACVAPSTYLKLLDRGFAKFDFTLISNRHNMMNLLMQSMVSNQNLMNHWHDMMIKNPSITSKTMSDWISQMKEDPELLANMMGPMTSDPQLRGKMIEEMKKHPIMEHSLKQNPKWMESVHMPMMSPSTGQDMHHEQCSWCPEYHQFMDQSIEFSNPDKMMDLIHHMWINDQMNQDMHEYMLQSPDHIAIMSEQMMSQMLDPMMNDPELREKMIELMLEHQEFMDSIRHEN
jgi:hypothetical protein